MMDNTYLDIADVMETFDPNELKHVIDSQIESLSEDSCENMIDNFKLLYTRYAALRDKKSEYDPEVYSEAEDRFFAICDIFIAEICDKYSLAISTDYIDGHRATLPSITLALYLFFVLDIRSNLFEILLAYINQNKAKICEQFEGMRQKHDAITTINRSMDDQSIALIASNIYDVVDWCMLQIDEDTFFDLMDKGYAALEPVKKMFDDGYINGRFIDSMTEIMKENISLKGRICFDIICQMKGYRFSE